MDDNQPTSPFGLTIEIPPHLVAIFERTEADLHEFYGDSPDVRMLIRMWLGCATPERVRSEFEAAVLDSSRNGSVEQPGGLPP